MNFKVGISETASTSDIATHDISNMVDVQAIVTAMADMEAQRKEQEQQFAVRMQDILEKTTESLQTELKQVKQYNKELMESNRIEAYPCTAMINPLSVDLKQSSTLMSLLKRIIKGLKTR